MGQYGPTWHGIRGIDGNNGNVYSVTYERLMGDKSSIPTSRPSDSKALQYDVWARASCLSPNFSYSYSSHLERAPEP